MVAFLNNLTNTVTAFSTFVELETAIVGGYVPTIYQNKRRNVILTKILRSRGHRVWTGSN